MPFCIPTGMNSEKLVIPLHFISWKTHFLILAGSVFYQIWIGWLTTLIIFGKMHFLLISENEFTHEIKCNGMTSFMDFTTSWLLWCLCKESPHVCYIVCLFLFINIYVVFVLCSTQPALWTGYLGQKVNFHQVVGWLYWYQCNVDSPPPAHEACSLLHWDVFVSGFSYCVLWKFAREP